MQQRHGRVIISFIFIYPCKCLSFGRPNFSILPNGRHGNTQLLSSSRFEVIRGILLVLIAKSLWGTMVTLTYLGIFLPPYSSVCGSLSPRGGGYGSTPNKPHFSVLSPFWRLSYKSLAYLVPLNTSDRGGNLYHHLSCGSFSVGHPTLVWSGLATETKMPVVM